MYKTASILPANIPIKMAIINMYKIILVSDTISLWVDGWESNSQPPEPQSGALPIELPSTLAPPAGIEPATFWLTVRCSTAELRRNYWFYLYLYYNTA